jgi:hypothetical protein
MLLMAGHGSFGASSQPAPNDFRVPRQSGNFRLRDNQLNAQHLTWQNQNQRLRQLAAGLQALSSLSDRQIQYGE